MTLGICGGILVGGSSRRMGQKKHLLEWRGKSWLAHVAQCANSSVDDLFYLGSARLPEDAPPGTSIEDQPDIQGPLSGILSALERRPNSAWIILACDLPRMNVSALSWLLSQRSPTWDAIIPQSPDGYVHPLCALYEPTALILLKDLAVSGRGGPRQLVQHSSVLSPVIPVNMMEAFRNFNAPEDLAHLEEA